MSRGFLANGVLLALVFLALFFLPLGTAWGEGGAPDAAPSPSPSPSAEGDFDWVACACGCSIFDVGDVYSMAPTNPTGGILWFRYAYMNQNQNWEGSHPAPASDNPDKDLETNFYFLGGQYTFNRQWTVMAELPAFGRKFTSTDDGTVQGPDGSLYTAGLFSLGDFKLMADYTGVSKDMSTGLMLGFKLPTGQWQPVTGRLGGTAIDRDSMPGTGSTDLMLGAYHVGSLTPDHQWPYQLQANYSMAFAIQQDYRPGNELDVAAGLGHTVGSVGSVEVTPWLSLLGSYRGHDTGDNADFLNSGYSRILLAPGVDLRWGKWEVYTDVEFPLFQYTNSAADTSIEGNAGQLTANQLYKFQLTRMF
ncbi:MAG TPA: hypothetical protein VGO93_19545 [Candidatus Xenobia bacterium]|jgi:hypothetical protein